MLKSLVGACKPQQVPESAGSAKDIQQCAEPDTEHSTGEGVKCIYLLPCVFNKENISLLTFSVSWMGEGVHPLEGMGIEGNGIDTVVHGKVVSNVPGSQAGTPQCRRVS